MGTVHNHLLSLLVLQIAFYLKSLHMRFVQKGRSIFFRRSPIKYRTGFTSVVIIALINFSGSSDESGMSCNNHSGTSIKSGKKVMVISSSIGTQGGTITINEEGSPIDGVIVEIPPDALDNEDVISLGYTDRKVSVRRGTPSDIALVLQARKTSSFKKPVSIKVPYNPMLNPDLVVPYEVDESGKLHVMDIGYIDKENHTLKFYTFKPCTCIWVYP